MIQQAFNSIIDSKYSVYITTAMSGFLASALVLHLDQSLQLLPI